MHKLRTDISVFPGGTVETSSGLTGETIESVTPENSLKKEKKTLAMSPPRKDPIPNQDKTIIGLEKYQFLISDVTTFLPGNKPLRNEENDDNPEHTDTSHTEKYDTSHTNLYDSITNVK